MTDLSPHASGVATDGVTMFARPRGSTEEGRRVFWSPRRWYPTGYLEFKARVVWQATRERDNLPKGWEVVVVSDELSFTWSLPGV